VLAGKRPSNIANLVQQSAMAQNIAMADESACRAQSCAPPTRTSRRASVFAWRPLAKTLGARRYGHLPSAATRLSLTDDWSNVYPFTD